MIKLKKILLSNKEQELTIVNEEIDLLLKMKKKIFNVFSEPAPFYLGKITPTIKEVSLDNIIDEFLYYYSFLSYYTIEGLDIYQLKKDLLCTINTIEKRKNIKLSEKHIWWLLALDYMRFLGDRHELYLIIDTTTTLINKIDLLSEEELIEYANLLNNSLYTEIGEGLRVRPLLAKDIHSDSIIEHKYFEKWIGLKDSVLSIIQSELDKKDFTNKLLNRELDVLNTLNIKFDEWDIFYEIFISHIVALTCPEDENNDIDIDLYSLESAISVTLAKLIKKITVDKTLENILVKNITMTLFY